MADFPSIGIQSMTMRLRSAVSMSSSPFTYQQQVYEHQGVMWEAEVTLPPLTRQDAKAIEGFLAGLRGMSGTFKLGCPIHTTTATGAITAGDIGDTEVAGTLSGADVGDYFEVNNALHIITEGASGGTFKIMPPLRTAISTSTALDFTLPKGTWRLSTSEVNWSIDTASIYGFTIPLMEAL